MSDRAPDSSSSLRHGDRLRQRAAERRRAERRDAGGLAADLRFNGSSYRVQIMDISETGFQAEGSVSIHAGQPVEIDLPNIAPVKATVRWGVGPYLGVQFDHPIDVNAVTGR